MEAQGRRILKDGRQYDALIEPAKGTYTMLQHGDATVFDTISTIKKVVSTSRGQVAKLAEHLKGRTVHDTCRNIWHFVYDHIQYKIDKAGTEEVRSPARVWADRHTGVDCDCYSTFISCLLTNLGISHSLRMTAYKTHHASGNELDKPWQHVYVIVVTNPAGYAKDPLNPAHYIVLDCVKDEFNAEHGPITAYKDYPMNLARLDGLGNTTETQLWSDDYTVDGLGRVVSRRGKKTKKVVAKIDTPVESKAAIVTATPNTVAPAAHQLVRNTAVARFPGQEQPGTRKMEVGKRAAYQQTRTISENTGVLKNGTTVDLGEAIQTEYFNNIFPGSSNGFTYHNRVLLRNGKPTGDKLMRFVVIDGVLKGHDVQGRFWTDFGDGNLRLIPGKKVWNPGVALGSIASIWQIDESGNLYSSLSGNQMFDTYGLLLDADYVRKQLADRRKKLGLSGTEGLSGLAALEAILDQHLENPDFVQQVLSIPVGDGDDINGICGLSGGLATVENVVEYPSLEHALYDQNGGVITIDGLGRVRRGSSRRAVARKTVTKNANAGKQEVDEQIPAATATTVGKELPLYIPANTLRNLLQLRLMNMARLNKNGHNFRNNLTLDGVDGLGMLGFLNNLFKDIGKTFSSQNILRQAAAATSFIPVVGSAISSVAQPLVNSAIDADNARGDMQRAQQQQQAMAAQAPVPVANAAAPMSMVNPNDLTNMTAEDIAAYNAAATGTAGLGNILAGPMDWVKKNPGTAIAAGAAGAFLIYRAMTASSSPSKRKMGLTGYKRKTNRKKSGSAAKSGSTHVAKPFKF